MNLKKRENKGKIRGKIDNKEKVNYKEKTENIGNWGKLNSQEQMENEGNIGNIENLNNEEKLENEENMGNIEKLNSEEKLENGEKLNSEEQLENEGNTENIEKLNSEENIGNIKKLNSEGKTESEENIKNIEKLNNEEKLDNKEQADNKEKVNNKKQPERKKKNTSKMSWLIICIAIICIAALVGGGFAAYSFNERQKEAKEAALLMIEKAEEEKTKEAAEKEKQKEEQAGNIFESVIEAGLNVFNSIKEKPDSVELEEGESEEFLEVESCLIDSKTSKVFLKTSSDSIPVSDDKYYYLFAIRSYEDSIVEDSVPITKEYKNTEVEFRFPRHFTGTESGVFRKFVVAIKKEGKYTAVSHPQYITNPEAVAKYKSNGEKPSSKKGLLIDPSKLVTSELDELGVKHAAYNIPVSRILGESTNGIYPTIYYSYNGKSYAFNGQVMSEYDLVFSTLTNKGIEISAIILNDVSAAYPQMIHPLARSGIGRAPYYAFNGADESGTEYLAAVGAFLSERYSGTANGRGLVANWIIGNEINARKEWNYMEYLGLQDYVKEYVKAYRVFYNAIKSINAASNVYISLDQQWDRNISNSTNYDTRDILDEFNSQIKEEGNIDWGLAIHPYNVPLTVVKIWAPSKYVKDSPDTSMVTMANINVVTDYMQREEFLMKDGKVRSVILSELGYTSLQGEELQAAAIVYAYKIAEANPYIDSILFSRQTDALEEMAQGLSLGLNHASGTHKYAYNVFKYMDTENADTYTDFAKSIIGISQWPIP